MSVSLCVSLCLYHLCMEMASGSKNYPKMLHGAIGFTTCFLGSIGIIGLLRFEQHGVEQIATENLPEKSSLTTCITSALIFAILFTFPLQIFPVIQCCEKWALKPSKKDQKMFSTDKSYNPLQFEASQEVSGQEEARQQEEGASNVIQLGSVGTWFFQTAGFPMLPDGESFDAIVVYGPTAGLHLRKTYLLRTVIILFASLIGLVAINYFSYIASLVGALGATALSFIIPSLIHMKLFPELSMKELVGDVAICFIGVVAAVVGLYVTIKDWVKAV